MNGLQQMLASALELHRSGRLPDAEQIYREIQSHDELHADSLHLLGVAAYKTAIATRLKILSAERLPLTNGKRSIIRTWWLCCRRGVSLMIRSLVAAALAGWRPDSLRRFQDSRWSGDDLAGGSVLLWGEQGIGDEIMFAGLVPDALRRGNRFILECEASLQPLFARSFPGADVVVAGHKREFSADLAGWLRSLRLRPILIGSACNMAIMLHWKSRLQELRSLSTRRWISC